MRAIVFLLEGGQSLDALLRLALLSGDVVVDTCVADDVARLYLRGEDKSLQTLAAAQCHIDLSRSEGSTRVDDGVLKGQSLALVDGDGQASRKGY